MFNIKSLFTTLALDAVLVALSWQALLSFTLNTPLSLPQRTVLGLSVWLVYVGDRLFDIKKIPPNKLTSQRHRLTLKLQPILTPLFYTLFAINVLLAFWKLNTLHLSIGLILLLICILYTKITARSKNPFIPKELVVGSLFTAGTLLFLITPQTLVNPTFWKSALVLTLLFNSNTCLVPFWEKPIDLAQNQSSLATQFPSIYSKLLILPCLTILLSLLLLPWTLSIPCILSSLGLLALHFLKINLTPESLHAYADLVLLSPVIILVIGF